MATPQLLTKKQNGVLNIAPSQIANNAKWAKAKQQPEGVKVLIRRLAPGLTEDEFVSILGESWKVGQGKVDWFFLPAMQH